MNTRELSLPLILVFIIISLALFSTDTFTVKFTGKATEQAGSSIEIDLGIQTLDNTFDGSTTNLVQMNDTGLEGVNLTLERACCGKVVFHVLVNLTQDAKNNSVDLDSNVDISHNWIEIDTTKLTSLERPATVYLYSLNLDDPRILRDGSVCPSSICEEISYLGGTLIFTVTNFTSYSAEETPVPPAPPAPLGPGPTPSPGGVFSPGGAFQGWVFPPAADLGEEEPSITTESDFILNKDLIKVSITQGESQRETMEITNTGNTTLSLTLELGSLETFMVISEESFSLELGEIKTVNIDIFAKEDEVPDAYTGRIIVQGDGITRIINVIIEIKEKVPLFDIRTIVTERNLRPMDDVEANITIVNVGDLRPIDILLYYAFKNFEGDIFLFREESLAIDVELNIVRSLEIPENVPARDYIFYSKVFYGNITAASSDTFEVVSDETEGVTAATSDILEMALLAGLWLIIIILAASNKRETTTKRKTKRKSKKQ